MEHLTCSQGHQNPLQSRFCQYCGEQLGEPQAVEQGTTVPPTDLQPISTALSTGTRLRDRYVIQTQIGQGGFGRAYRAEDTGRFNEPVVLKELLPSVQGTYALKKAEELFQREALTLHRLQHPQIPRFWEIFQAQRRLFLVQDFIPGSTYQQLLMQRQQQGQTFSETEVLQLLRDLLPVLSYLHHQGIIHRDISPDNIIRRDSDQLPVLIDLGGVKQIALEIEHQVAERDGSGAGGTRLGKIGYSPDEQMRLGVVAPHSDLYALAVTSLVLLTGKSPQDLQDPYSLEWRWQQCATVSPALATVLDRMLAARPVHRYGQASEVLMALTPPGDRKIPETIYQPQDSRTPEAVEVEHPTFEDPLPSRSSSNTTLWVIASLITLSLLGLGAAFYGRQLIGSNEPVNPSTALTEEMAQTQETQAILEGNPSDIQMDDLVAFRHESGAFEWVVPSNWSVSDRSESDFVSVQWSDPTGLAFLTAFVVTDLEEPDLDTWIEVTLTALENTVGQETDFQFEGERTAFDDGQVRLIWTYTESDTGSSLMILGNTFMQVQGSQAGVIQFQLPRDEFERLQPMLDQIVNGFILSP
ncbi:protein kinase [Synechococcales cyanobacterium C]|uniref:non-specific serine/threonine protein kinase n=1 Tax=Petrachloros mirabilis ULC683 TaxID=2781853 RepID=A0A8K2ACA9_9CYAN|nr:serine/threonine-protein kinase [Petrachloros mirabilis]NCJ05134.1 protein kinase [Petrachloros mirabilis ULC683]